ncbi:hypothetical protein [Paraglaciecola sp.]|uniref:hypothetical protein n=1 Tax=Paraglaciecola sp. TaxID=1920173 RepID=UPI0030F372DE
MLARVYLPPFITALFGGLFVALGILTFGNAYIFDRLFIGVLIFTALICFKNINIVSLLTIILLQRIIEELAWAGLNDSYVAKELVYLLGLVMIYTFRYDPMVKFATPTLLLTIAAEIYWYVSDYPAPEVYWPVLLLLSNLFTRYMIFSRLEFVERYFPKKSQSTNLDWIIYKLTGTTVIIQSLLLLEYIIRHVFELHQLLVMYHSYPYLVHGIAIFAIWATFNESYKQILPRLLKA